MTYFESAAWKVAAFWLFISILLISCIIPLSAWVYGNGWENGYKECLDDIRLGRPAKFKLVQTAEKWVEVDKEKGK